MNNTVMEVPPIEMIKEAEIAWLSEELGRCISNLGYPVGCGIAPHPETLKIAAEKLFDRYERMIEFARAAPPPQSKD